MCELLAGEVERLQPMLAHAKVDVEVEKQGEAWVEVDAMRISQALRNLLTNAAQAMPDGGEIRAVAREAGGSDVQHRRPECGFSEQAMQHFGEAFFSEKEGGMGIGLTLVKEVLEAHGGSIHRKTDPTAGRSSSANSRKPERGSMKPKKILIVEDNRALGAALAAASSQTGASTELVATASLARKELESAQEPFTAMVLDIGLPNQNGLELLESLPESCRPPTIVITAHGELDNTIHARKLGVLAFFPKPLDFGAFKEALGNLPVPIKDEVGEDTPHSTFIGAAPAMRPVFQQIAQACASDVPVLISGETGTGKSWPHK